MIGPYDPHLRVTRKAASSPALFSWSGAVMLFLSVIASTWRGYGIAPPHMVGGTGMRHDGVRPVSCSTKKAVGWGFGDGPALLST